jgi:hypothetical protein
VYRDSVTGMTFESMLGYEQGPPPGIDDFNKRKYATVNGGPNPSSPKTSARVPVHEPSELEMLKPTEAHNEYSEVGIQTNTNESSSDEAKC